MEILPDRKDVDDLTEWFTVFTNTSEEESEALRLNFEIKREHTKRVVEEITYIGNAFGLSQMELNMAEIIALLHKHSKGSRSGVPDCYLFALKYLEPESRIISSSKMNLCDTEAPWSDYSV